MSAELAQSLLNWYKENARSLPWRDHPDPYAIWVSEIMLQQTRVETVIPYFERWMEHFPDIASLAAAPLQDVLMQWEGLGYYSRARNLHQAAGVAAAEYEAELPKNLDLLRRLPGIGRYTAAAIASMAFGLDAAALDGNIRRVLARVFDVTETARSTAGEKRLWALAEANLPAGKAGDYNQALMDLGSLVCTPKSPNCRVCPLAGLCLARQRGVQEERPVTAPRSELPHYTVAAAVIQRDGTVLIAQRPPEGLLGGLWEFPGGKLQEDESLAQALQREICEELQAEIIVGEAFGVYKHAFTHFRITLHAFRCTLMGSEPYPVEASAIRWVRPEELPGYPMGKVDRQIATRLSVGTRSNL
jgi:A/G-specific adenine glycosylase